MLDANLVSPRAARRQAELKINTAERGDAFVIHVAGELDHECSPELERALTLAEDSRAAQIVLDLDGLRLIDSTGLAVMLRASHRSIGDRLRLTNAKGYVADMFRFTALDKTLPVTFASESGG